MTLRNITVFALTVALAALLAAEAHGQSTRLQPANPDSALAHIIESLDGTRLGLDAAVAYGLENATSLRAAEGEYLARRGVEKREAGFFDPELFLAFNHFDDERRAASFFAGAPVLATTETAGVAGLRLVTPIGTKLEASLSTVRFQTNSAFATLNPQYDAFGQLSLRQPLLSGFQTSARKDLVRAQQGTAASRARYDQEAVSVSVQVEKAYWNLYAAERDYAVQQLTRDRAKAFLEETEVRARIGLVGPNQVANARTFLAEQELLLIDSLERMGRLTDALASLIGVRPQPGDNHFITVDDPPDEFPLGDVEDWVRVAAERNLNLAAAEADVEAVRALWKAARWEALPSLDLVGSIGGNGLAGSPQDVVFGSDTLRTDVSGSLGDASREALQGDYPAWSVGLELSVPIGLRPGRGERDRLRAEVTIAEQRVIDQRRQLEERVRTSYRELDHGQRRLGAAREGVAAAREQVRIGLIDFQNGRTTAFELVRLGADLAVAERRYSEALVRSAQAAAALKEWTSGAYPDRLD